MGFRAWNFTPGREYPPWQAEAQKDHQSQGQYWPQNPGLWALNPVFFLGHSIEKSQLPSLWRIPSSVRLLPKSFCPVYLNWQWVRSQWHLQQPFEGVQGVRRAVGDC